MSDDPINAVDWPDKLPARVVEEGRAPRLQGYEVDGDLARHYHFADVVFLALTGELPKEKTSGLFERILILLSPANAGSAATHAAGVSRLCGASEAAVFATSAGLLAQTAASGEVSHLGWEEPALEEALARLFEEEGFEVPWTRGVPASEAVASALEACGLTSEQQRVAAVAIGALPASIAEALAWRRGGFKTYPMNLPAFRYEEDEDE